MSVLADAGFCQKTPQIPVFSDKTVFLGGSIYIYIYIYMYNIYTFCVLLYLFALFSSSSSFFEGGQRESLFLRF